MTEDGDDSANEGSSDGEHYMSSSSSSSVGPLESSEQGQRVHGQRRLPFRVQRPSHDDHCVHGLESNMIRRRNGVYGRNSSTTYEDLYRSQSSRGRRRRRESHSFWYTNQRFIDCLATCSFCTAIVLCIGVWVLNQIPVETGSPRVGMTVQERIRARREQKKRMHLSFMEYAQNGFWGLFLKNTQSPEVPTPPNPQAKRKVDVEALRPGCLRADWQYYNFQNCNDIHAVDLRSIQVRQLAKHSNVGYLDSGLWRTVWAIDFFQNELAVLKVMKAEHEVDRRNFDRHRRDALAMERLTYSPNVVDIYGFCGNNVLTEYADTTLDDVINDGKTTKNGRIIATRETVQGRLQLALDAARGLEALHSIQGGPIVHADIQAKQFLIDSAGRVKLNDFNRCRFMGRRNSTAGEACPFKIPTAPGKARAPEEYDLADLDEKLDVYSLGHVYYEILTGYFPWNDWGTGETKRKVQEGEKPAAPKKYRKPGTLDDAFYQLILQAYEHDTDKRPSASQLASMLGRLVSKAASEEQLDHLSSPLVSFP